MGIMSGQNHFLVHMIWSIWCGPYDIVHIIWSIWYEPYHRVDPTWNLALKQWVFELVFAFITKIRIQIFTNFLWFFWFVVIFDDTVMRDEKVYLVPCPWNFPLAQIDGPGFFIYIQFIKSEESLQVFDWFDYLLEDSIFFCLALSPSVLVGRLRCSIYRCSSCLLVLILEYSWTQCTVFVEIVWGRIRVTQWSRKFDRWLTWAICASCTA